jgi:hypothetical protein
LKRPSLYLAFAAPVALACAFYIVRENAIPGYLAAALHSDFARYTEGVDARPGSPLYYVLQPRNLPWLAVLPFALGLCWRYGRSREKALMAFLAVSYLGYFLVLSLGETKQGWYALPLHPLCALMIGIGFSAAIRHYATGTSRWGSFSGVATVACAAMALLVLGLNAILVTYYYPGLVAEPRDRYSFFLRELPQLMPDHKRITVLHPGYSNSAGFAFYVAPARFYATALADRGYDISLQPLDAMRQPKDGEVLLECGDEIGKSTARKPGAVTIAEAYGCIAWTSPSRNGDS